MSSIGISISNGTITINNAFKDQAYLKVANDNFKILREKVCKEKPPMRTVNAANDDYHYFIVDYFRIIILSQRNSITRIGPATTTKMLHPSTKGSNQGRGIKVLLQKEMLQRLLILLAQIQSRYTSDSFLNKTRQISYSVCQVKETSKNIYNNLIKQIQRSVQCL